MITRPIIIATVLLLSSPLMAFPCFITLVKDSCWADYAITVNVLDVDTNQSILTLSIPKGQSWTRQSFICQPSQKIVYKATFEPTIWEGAEGAVYDAQHYWQLPDKATVRQKAWEVPICFPQAFAEVPFPPQASGNCQCDFAAVPPIPPQP